MGTAFLGLLAHLKTDVWVGAQQPSENRMHLLRGGSHMDCI
jgi:hypothetical protein